MKKLQGKTRTMLFLLLLAAVIVPAIALADMGSFTIGEAGGCQVEITTPSGTCGCAATGSGAACVKLTKNGKETAWCTEDKGDPDPDEVIHCQEHNAACACKTVERWRATVPAKANLNTTPEGGWGQEGKVSEAGAGEVL